MATSSSETTSHRRGDRRRKSSRRRRRDRRGAHSARRSGGASSSATLPALAAEHLLEHTKLKATLALFENHAGQRTAEREVLRDVVLQPSSSSKGPQHPYSTATWNALTGAQKRMLRTAGHRERRRKRRQSKRSSPTTSSSVHSSISTNRKRALKEVPATRRQRRYHKSGQQRQQRGAAGGSKGGGGGETSPRRKPRRRSKSPSGVRGQAVEGPPGPARDQAAASQGAEQTPVAYEGWAKKKWHPHGGWKQHNPWWKRNPVWQRGFKGPGYAYPTDPDDGQGARAAEGTTWKPPLL